MRVVACIVLLSWLACIAYAKPVLDRSNEAKGYLLEKMDIPGWKLSFVRLSDRVACELPQPQPNQQVVQSASARGTLGQMAGLISLL